MHYIRYLSRMKLIFYQVAKVQNLFQNLGVKAENNCSVWRINNLFLSKTSKTFW